MPAAPKTPGVHIEEIPSGVRTITGAATSITAFLGRTLRGPVNEPVSIHSYADFELRFGGLWAEGPLGYTVRDFFLNGGTDAIVVRLYKNDGDDDGVAKATIAGIKLKAVSPGDWANNLEAEVDVAGINGEVAARCGLEEVQLFNLTLREKNAGGEVVLAEQFPIVSVVNGPRQVDRVLEEKSVLARADGALPRTWRGRPAAGGGEGEGGEGDEGDEARTQPVEDASVETKRFSGGKNGAKLDVLAYTGSRAEKTGIYALKDADLFNLMCIPPDMHQEETHASVYQEALEYCVERRAMLIVDPPKGWTTKDRVEPADLQLSGVSTRNAALYFPRVRQTDPLRENQIGTFAPCGVIAGLIARTDATRGVWKAPAGTEAVLHGTKGLAVNLTDAENGDLNALGINCLRSFPSIGPVAWGARTLRGADHLADEYKYIPVRRLALFIEESLYRGTQWVVFEPNDEPLWATMRVNVGAFMHDLFRQGAFAGTTPREAYFVQCDRTTTTQSDVDLGIVNIHVGFAPLKPAEFVIIKIRQVSGEVQA